MKVVTKMKVAQKYSGGSLSLGLKCLQQHFESDPNVSVLWQSETVTKCYVLYNS